MQRVNYKMIVLARESRGYTQTELAALINIPQGNLSRMERGDIPLKDENLEKVCEVLKYPKSFFYQQNQICPADTYYRKAVSVDQKTKLKVEAIMNIYKFNIEEMLKDLEIPTNNIPILSEQYESAEKMAMYVRSYWGVPKGPIDNLSKIIEDNGIIIIQMDFETDKIDGRTILTSTGHPIIFINSLAPGDRQRTTLAHELGHLILHMGNMPLFGRDEETEAYNFGNEFLMPLSEVKYDFNNNISLEKIADIKRVWKVSMQSILYRVQDKKLATYNRCRYLWSQISSRGWRKSEPIEIPKENPTLVSRMVNMFIADLGYSKDEIAGILNVEKTEFENRYLTVKGKLRVA